ncbi:hypothetical protein Q4Q39_09655 [Flavivirga amylovorans]|uniref:Uncharacterized protein n=1 Tax=Flavivirga amylovorans TaxID=870486 RepID=A0ABT8X133_9FLAO|nr:hypothetical protein [Flavivirga amylovorans]MDO5987662.1 hypothetical protein [Flavivirga amylovorans]
MKNLIFAMLFFSFCFFTNAQDNPKIGDELIINAPQNVSYNHIDFPRLNFLVKKGRLANYKNVYGNKVIVKDIINENNGITYVVLKKKNGKKFFGYLNTVKANYSKSIESGELATVTP